MQHRKILQLKIRIQTTNKKSTVNHTNKIWFKFQGLANVLSKVFLFILTLDRANINYYNELDMKWGHTIKKYEVRLNQLPIRRIHMQWHTSASPKSSLYHLDQSKVADLFWVPHVSLCFLRTSVKKQKEKKGTRKENKMNWTGWWEY